MATTPEELVLAVALPNEPASAAKARAAVARAFAGLPDDVVEDAQLLVSEAVTNAIRHSERGPDSPIRLAGFLAGTVARIEVADEGAVPIPDDARRGIGFSLFDVLSSAWGFGDREGRVTTWFELDAAVR